MAGLSAMNNPVHVPVRSISLPCRLHPNSLKIEAEITKLRPSSPSNPFGVETLQAGLAKLAELFICIDELALSARTQQSFHHHHHVNQVEDALDGSVGLIDVCSTARDLFLTMEEHIQNLQSALRRRGNDSSIERYVQAYIIFRKRAKKDITKCIKTLRKLKRKTAPFPMCSEEHPLAYLIKVTKEAHAIAVGIFESVLLFLSLPVMKTNTNRWSLISKLIRSGFVASDKDRKIDIALFSIRGEIRKNDASFDVQELKERLERVGGGIHDIEAKLECVFRCLIQHRVSLLNLVTA